MQVLVSLSGFRLKMNDFNKKEREGERGMEVYEVVVSTMSEIVMVVGCWTRSMPHQGRELNGGATWLGTR